MTEQSFIQTVQIKPPCLKKSLVRLANKHVLVAKFFSRSSFLISFVKIFNRVSTISKEFTKKFVYDTGNYFFFVESMLLRHDLSNFQIDHLSMKSLKILKYSLPVKNAQNFGDLASRNFNFHKNLSP